MEACAGFERIAIENTTPRGDDLLEIGKGREAQMIGYMRHGAPPRLMAPQFIRSADLRESHPTPSPGNRIIGAMADIFSTGLVSDLAHPGGNITGFTTMNVDLGDKWLEMLKEVVPHLARVGVLWNATNPINEVTVARGRRMAEAWDLALDLVEVRNRDEIKSALSRLTQTDANGVLVAPDTMLLSERKQIVEAMEASRLPAGRFT